MYVKQQLQSVMSKSIDDINVFIFDDDDTDIEWMLSVAHQTDLIIIDIDNCDSVTKKFVTFMLAQPNVYYITSDEITPYGLISKNRIYDLEFIVNRYNDEDIDEDDDDSEE